MYCYICNKKIERSHFFYKNMCETCGKINYNKRNELINLKGYVAVVTGGRVKIGYETALKLLRSKAFVIITTRFPYQAAIKFSEEPDFNKWNKKLKIYGIDFRITPYLYEFIEYLKYNFNYIDILINNAAQTVRPSKQEYEKFVELEKDTFYKLDNNLKKLIPKKKYISNINSIQLYKAEKNNNLIIESYTSNYYTQKSNIKNSWNSKACDVSVIELLENQLINITAPFVLSTELRSLMESSPHKLKYIINVSAMEGKFYKKNKNCFHPHTNMCKAAINMFTRTSAQDYIKSGILMNSVDTGWITDENPSNIKSANIKKGIMPQLDEKDGASRICDPIFSSIERNINTYGMFLKNYRCTEW